MSGKAKAKKVEAVAHRIFTWIAAVAVLVCTVLAARDGKPVVETVSGCCSKFGSMLASAEASEEFAPLTVDSRGE